MAMRRLKLTKFGPAKHIKQPIRPIIFKYNRRICRYSENTLYIYGSIVFLHGYDRGIGRGLDETRERPTRCCRVTTNSGRTVLLVLA